MDLGGSWMILDGPGGVLRESEGVPEGSWGILGEIAGNLQKPTKT